MTLVAHEFETQGTFTDASEDLVSFNGALFRPGETFRPTVERVHALAGQLAMLHTLDTQGNPAYRPVSKAAPIAPPKDADPATRDAFHREFAAWSKDRNQASDITPVSPVVGHIQVHEDNPNFYELRQYDSVTGSILPYEGVELRHSAIYHLQLAEIAEEPPLALE